MNRRLGWVLGLATSVSVTLIYHDQMIRMYSLFTFLSCLSVLSFLRALKTNSWKAWTLTALANVLGFYTFLFMGFLILAEGLVVMGHSGRRWRRYLRPILTQAPALLLMMVWMVFALRRARAVEQDFWYGPVSQTDLVKLWVFLGTGTDFQNRYLLTFLLNLPFLTGVILCFHQWRRNPSLRIIFALMIIPIVLAFAISIAGPPIVFKRYFIFLLPLYLALAFAGWLSLDHPPWRRLGAGMVFAILIASTVYYFADYYEQHSGYFFIEPFAGQGSSDGHAPSHMAKMLRARIVPHEAVVHFSSFPLASFSFFPMVYYNNRSLPEYLYSKEEVKDYFGNRYLQKGDRIKKLADLRPLPEGVWLVTLGFQEDVFGVNPPRWVREGNLPEELREAGYQRLQVFAHGNVTAIHFRRSGSQMTDAPGSSR